MRKKIYLTILAVFSCLASMFAGNLPVIYITTADSSAITSRDYWKENTAMQIVMPDGSTSYQSKTVSIKARGHSTFNKPKKPYVFKLEDKVPLLGMADGKEWILLANFMDHSLLRNSLAFAISKQTSLEWTPDSRLVDVVVNGKLQGCYLLCESIHVKERWVSNNDKNSFLIEIDNYPNDKYRLETSHRHLPVNVIYPKTPTDERIKSIESYLNRVEDILYGKSSDRNALYRDLIDMDTFIDWWIVHELTQNAEPNGPRSCYMHKGEDGALKAGPVWDFDLAFITVGLDDGGDIRPSRLNRPDVVTLTGDSIYNRNALWYGWLLKDPVFENRLKERWADLEPKFLSLLDELDNWQKLIEPSALADEQLWKGQDPARFDTFTDWKSSVRNLREVYRYRINSLHRLLLDEKTFQQNR